MKEVKQILETLVDFEQQVLVPNKMDYLIVGSLALNLLGLENEVHDIDLEVICTPEQEAAIFRLLSRSQQYTFHEQNYSGTAEARMDKITWSPKPYLFSWNGVMINVWVVSKFSHPYVTLKSGHNVATLMSVLRKKTAYNREKDVRFMAKYAAKFIEMTMP